MSLMKSYLQLYKLEKNKNDSNVIFDRIEELLVSLSNYTISYAEKTEIIRECLDYSVNDVFQAFLFNDIHSTTHEILIDLIKNYSSIWNITENEKNLVVINEGYQIFYSDAVENKICLIVHNKKIKAMAYSKSSEVIGFVLDELLRKVVEKYKMKLIEFTDLIEALEYIFESNNTQILEHLVKVEENILYYSNVILENFNIFNELDAQIRYSNKNNINIGNLGLKLLSILDKEKLREEYLTSRLSTRSLLNNECKELIKKSLT